MNNPPISTSPKATDANGEHFRFHKQHAHLSQAFGNDWFGEKAESFARLFGTPAFLIAQTLLVIIWIALNCLGIFKFDLYPFILLNLAFSLQAAYAAPLILLAQTRQADRDKAHADADAQHREAIAQASQERLDVAAEHTGLLLELMRQNTELTQLSVKLGERIEALTDEIHRHILGESPRQT